MSWRMWLMPLLATAAGLAVVVGVGSPEVREGWLLGVVTLAGLAAASLGLLMIGHLLGDRWLAPVRDELEPAAVTLPAIALLALPLALGVDQLYPWARAPELLPHERREWFKVDWFLVRAALYLVVWSLLAYVLTRPGDRRRASGFGLAVLAGTFSMASTDWIMSREPHWWSSLFGFAFAVSQLLAALAAAILVTVARQSHPESGELESLERALLTLALLTGWVWFAQFLVVWMANLPGEAQWYLMRVEGGWGWLKAVVVIPSLALSILLLLPSRGRAWRVLVACGLLLVHHTAHMMWLISPAAPGGAFTLTSFGVALGAGLLWLLWFGTGLARHVPLQRAAQDQGRPAPTARGAAVPRRDSSESSA